MIIRWFWWSTFILLLLRLESYQALPVTPVLGESETTEAAETTTALAETTTTKKKGPITADELGVARCQSNYQCVNNGVCDKDADGIGRCLCRRSCNARIPMHCRTTRFFSKDALPCGQMDTEYSKKYQINQPSCHKGRCVCPPMFDNVSVAKFPIKTLLPVKCDKRELQVVGVAFPSDSVYKSTDVRLYCCINIDPTNHIDANGVTFVQNETVTREPTKHPFRESLSEYEQLVTPSCWELEIPNVQLSDSGSYMCVVTPAAGFQMVNYTIEFHVKAPRMLQNLQITTNETAANVTWDVQEGPQLKIDLKLIRRSDYNGKEVWSQEHAKPPLTITGLRAATNYALNFKVKDAQMEPFEMNEQLITKEAKPNAPRLIDVRVGYNSALASSSASLNCEVDWKSPALTNGRIIKYYVRVRGQLRHHTPDGALMADDYPPATDKKCANYDEQELGTNGINPIDFSNDLLFCKYGPLKPNRNYTVTIWAENSAGRSIPITSAKNCVTHYAQPEQVEKPQTSTGANHSSFNLAFKSKPDDTNGPISCYYTAVIPLPSNVSLDSLPAPSEIVVDTFSKAFINNMQPFSERKIYFAYIAESYTELPETTIIGDGIISPNMKPCGVLYLSRHRSEDAALRSSMKYTGFLIVRVDKEKEDSAASVPSQGTRRRPVGSRTMRDFKKEAVEELSSRMIDNYGGRRSHRQLQLSGPLYGYSGYFKPVYLQEESERSAVTTVLNVLIPVVLFAIIGLVAAAAILHRKGMINEWCPLKISKDNIERTPLKPCHRVTRGSVKYSKLEYLQPVPVEELSSEYVMRHRDSDFLFGQEYEQLPHFDLPSVASCRKENLCKNRYNDIRAFDQTRVKLKKIDGLDHTDYINGNMIQSWNGEKQFIATQAPLESTVADFWRMIWEQESRMVIMVANLMEKNRAQCVKYWPDEVPLVCGNLIITLVKTSYNVAYNIREFDIIEDPTGIISNDFRSSKESNVGSEYANVPSSRLTDPRTSMETAFGREIQPRRVIQYHFTNWNDYRAPECSTSLLRFLHLVRGLPEFTTAPVIIHCSAGVGRTGTFIAIDSMLDQCEAEGKADIFGFVSKLRKQRNLMVQSCEQYVFIFKALAEWYLYGQTDMDIHEFCDHYKKLKDPTFRDRFLCENGQLVSPPDADEPVNGMDMEFRKLSKSLEPPPKISFASNEENIMKNRFEASVPYDRNRVVLAPLIGFDSSYINASDVKGYFYPYIMSQDPISEATVFDFWRMIQGKNVSTVVMLSQEEDWSHSEKYWPEDREEPRIIRKSKQHYTVELIEESRYPYYVVRKMRYESTVDPGIWSDVVQFAINDWSSDSPTPATAEALLKLIGIVLERQSKLPDSTPIILHSRNGSKQTGIFCCVSLLLERMKAEQRVDVFQTVKGLQMQRPMLFTQLEEYEFCYRAVIDYLRTTNATL